MTKNEAIKLAVSYNAQWNRSDFGLPASVEFGTESDFLAFANAIQKIGMERAINDLCNSHKLTCEDASEALDAIRANKE